MNQAGVKYDLDYSSSFSFPVNEVEEDGKKGVIWHVRQIYGIN